MKNFKIKLTNTISAILVCGLSPVLNAQSIVMAPADKWINQVNLNLTNSAKSFSEQTSFNFLNNQIVSDQVSLSGQFIIKRFESESQTNLFNLEANLNNANVMVKDLQIHLRIEQDLGFGSATINLDAVCESVSVQIKNPQPLIIKFNKNFQAEKLQLLFSDENVLTSVNGCTQIAGLDQEIQAKVLSIIRSQLFEKQLKQIITNQISNEIDLKVKSISKNFVETNQDGLNYQYKIDLENRLWVHVGENAQTSFSDQDVQELSKSSSIAALIKKSQLEKTILTNLNAQLKKTPILSESNEKLQKLTCSRWTQFFVWPALKAFPKCFKLQFISEIKDLKLTDLTKLNFSINANSWAQATEPFRNIAYFNIQSDVTLNPSDVKIKSIKGQHDPEFLKWSNRSSRISSGLVTSTLQDYLKEQLGLIVKNNPLLDANKIKQVKPISEDTLFVQLK